MFGGEAIPYDLKIVPLPTPEEKTPEKKPEAKPQNEDAKEAKPEPLPLDVENFDLSADGRWLAILAKDPQTAAEKKKDTDKDDADFVDHDPHGVRLYLLSLDAAGAAFGSPVRTDIAPDVQGIAWAPHTNKLAVVTETPNNVGDLHPARSAWVLERSGDTWKSTALTKVPATVEERFVWTKDEASLLILAQAQQDAPPGINDLYLAERTNWGDPSTQPRFPRNHPPGNRRGRPLRARCRDSRLHRNRRTISPRRWKPYNARIQSLRSQQPQHQCRTDRMALRTKQLRNSAATLLRAHTLCRLRQAQHPRSRSSRLANRPSPGSQVEERRPHHRRHPLPAAAGGLQGKDGGKIPLIVDVHGGPTGQFTDNYSAFAQFLLGHGWAVLETNPRGSTGYGAAFAAANKNDLGGGDYQDIMTGVDTVLAKFPIDANKMALIGYSYGGEMAGFVEGKTDRFRAIVSGAPVIDQMSEYGTEDSSYYDRWWYGYPWEHEQDAWRQSPIAGVAHAKTPFLLLQGKGDTTDPAGQSEEMYRALRQAGVTVELVEYPRENHGPLARGMLGYPSPEPWHGFDARRRIIDFISKQFEAAAKK